MKLRRLGYLVITLLMLISQFANPMIALAETSSAAEASVTEKAAPTSVSLDKKGIVNLDIDQTLQLTATLNPLGSEATLKWKSSNSKIASVSVKGLVTPKKEGTVTITVTANKKKASVKVKIVDPYKPTRVSLDKSGTVSLDIDKKLELTATLKPSTAKSKLKWATSNKKIATVNEKGVVTPKKEGTTTITVTTANNKSAKVKVKVVDPYKPTGISLSKSGTVSLDIDKKLELTATLKPSTAKSKLTWKTSNKKIATVNEKGVVTPKKEGTTTITVTTANKKSAKVKVKVVDPYKPTGVKLNKSGTVTLNTEETLELKATLSPSTAKSAVTWKSSKGSIASVSNAGVVTAKKKGTVTITATTSSGKKTAKVKIKVADPKKPTSVKLNMSGTVSVAMGKTLALAGTLQPSNAKSTIKWTTSNAKVAEVSASGLVTPKGDGMATITAKTARAGKSATVSVRVTGAVACGVSTHYMGDGKTHTAAVCGTKGHYNCDGKNHAKLACGHYACAGGTHTAAACGTKGHYACDGKSHAKAVCGTNGHSACDGKSHAKASCGTNGHYACDGKNHDKQACGHLTCASGTHTAAACGTKGHYACDGKSHVKQACGHFSCVAGTHTAAACNTKGHYACDGKSHAKLACGHNAYACAPGTHVLATCGTAGHYKCDGKDHASYKGYLACDPKNLRTVTIEYWLYDENYNGTKAPENIAQMIKITKPIGTSIDLMQYIVDIPGYRYTRIGGFISTISVDDEWVDIEYVVDSAEVYPYEIRCVDIDGVKLLPSYTGASYLSEWITAYHYIDAFKERLPGYNYVSVSDWELMIGRTAKNNVITITFVKNTDTRAVPFTVEYLDNEGNKLRPSQTYYSVPGIEVYEEMYGIPEIEGYEWDYDKSTYYLTVSTDLSKNVIRIVYDKYYLITVNYVDIETGEQIREPWTIDYYLEGETYRGSYYDTISGYTYLYPDRSSVIVGKDISKNMITHYYAKDTSNTYPIEVTYVDAKGGRLKDKTYYALAGAQLTLNSFDNRVWVYYDEDYDIEYQSVRMTPTTLIVSASSSNAVTVYCEEVPDYIDVPVYVYLVDGNTEELYYETYKWYKTGETVSLADIRSEIESWSWLNLNSKSFLYADKDSYIIQRGGSISLYYSVPKTGEWLQYTMDVYFENSAGNSYYYDTWWDRGYIGDTPNMDEMLEWMREYEYYLNDFLRTEPANYKIDPNNRVVKYYFAEPVGVPVWYEIEIFFGTGSDSIHYKWLDVELHSGEKSALNAILKAVENEYGLEPSTLIEYKSEQDPLAVRIGDSWNWVELYYPNPADTFALLMLPELLPLTVHHVDDMGTPIAEDTHPEYAVGLELPTSELALEIDSYEPISMEPETFIVSEDETLNEITITYRLVEEIHTPGNGTEDEPPQE